MKIQTLTKLHNVLLPKLISGKIRLLNNFIDMGNL
ncbi:hypothetical protein [uncultured Gammaproteobacteria bacterium]|jgi:hypothetical protein|nr:hypothetical protein [uncultured Gammaproteobacteria bacterium]CAC9958318.1 hypothetical protein [uncultured Gammaproteobacteria bacterium]